MCWLVGFFGSLATIIYIIAPMGFITMYYHLRYLGNEKRAPGCLGSRGDEFLPSYVGIIS